MKRHTKKSRSVLPIVLSISMCSASMGVLAPSEPAPAYAQTAGNAAPAKASANAPHVTAASKTLTREEVNKMPGCVANFETIDGVKYLVIKPKDDKNEGVISADLKADDFERIQYNILFRNYGCVLKFEGKIYGYGSIAGLFSDANIESLGNIDAFDVSNVTNMSNLFKNCVYLTSLNDLKNWNTSNVKDMSYLFSGCTNLSDISGLQNWNTANVTTMEAMFGGTEGKFDSVITGCEQLKTLQPLSNWDTKNVKNMSYMFNDCKSLENLNGLEKWNTANVTTMKGMFGGKVVDKSPGIIVGCEQLKNLDGLKNWNTSNVTDMSYICLLYTSYAADEAGMV